MSPSFVPSLRILHLVINLLLTIEVCSGTKLLSNNMKMVVDDPRVVSHEHELSILYRDVPKAGGSTTVKLLHTLVGRGALGGTPVRLVEEYEPLNLTAASSQFVIGPIREPCSYYVSLFAYRGDDFLGEGKSRANFDMASNESVPMFHRWLDEVLKKRHANKSHHLGVVSLRFWLLYAGGDGPPLHRADQIDQYVGSVASQELKTFFDADRQGGIRETTDQQQQSRPIVDCWVETSVLVDGLERCLWQFKEQHPTLGSRMRWDRIEEVLHPPLKNQTTRSSGDNPDGGGGGGGGSEDGGGVVQSSPAVALELVAKEQREKRRLRQRGYYQVTGTHFNASPHLPCAAYFNPDTEEGERARLLVASRDSALNGHFGFACCEGSQEFLSQEARAT
jgi:hypothetical protein